MMKHDMLHIGVPFIQGTSIRECKMNPLQNFNYLCIGGSVCEYPTRYVRSFISGERLLWILKSLNDCSTVIGGSYCDLRINLFLSYFGQKQKKSLETKTNGSGDAQEAHSF